ncbi:ribosome maturation factor RimM, partial [Chloroflexota bacterium]
VQVLTDFPERFSTSSEVFIDQKPVTITEVGWNKGRAIIQFDSVDSEKEADNLRNKLIEIHHSQLQSLQEGQYYHFELVGLKVLTSSGEFVGNITEIITMSSHDTYVVKGPRGEVLIPAVEEVVKSVDLGGRSVVIEPIKGLLELNEKAVK